MRKPCCDGDGDDGSNGMVLQQGDASSQIWNLSSLLWFSMIMAVDLSEEDYLLVSGKVRASSSKLCPRRLDPPSWRSRIAAWECLELSIEWPRWYAPHVGHRYQYRMLLLLSTEKASEVLTLEEKEFKY